MSRYLQRRHLAKSGLQNVVVLIEDDKSLRDDLSYLLEAERLEVVAVADGMAGLAAIQEHQPRVVILDMYVPHYSGFEIADSIRDDAGLKGVFVIAITGMAEDEEDLKAMRGRADVIMAKPLNEHRLLEYVRAAMAHEQALGLRPYRDS